MLLSTNGARRRSGETARLVRVLVGGERFDRPVRQGRSPLYLEVLGELGVVGFVLVLALVGFGVSVGIVRARLFGRRAVQVAALTAVFTAYVASAGIDWVWELTAVSVVGFVALGLIAGPATASCAAQRDSG